MNKIDVYVLSGFLGSGKTTFLLNLLQYFKKNNKKTAIILNELGSVHIEEHLFKGERMIELLDGCICCSSQEDLQNTLNLLWNQQLNEEPIDVLLIEGTGVAHPREISDVLQSSKMREIFSIKSIIGVVDASRFLNYLSIFSTSIEVRNLLKEQVVYSTTLLLNKTDCTDDIQLKKVIGKINSLKKKEVPVIKTTYGQCNIKEILSIRDEQIEPWESYSPTRGSHHRSIKTVKFDQVPTFDQQFLTDWLMSMPESVIRAKGIVQLQGEQQLTHVQFADKRVRYSNTETCDKRKPVFVFIGKNVTKEMFIPFLGNKKEYSDNQV